MMRNILLIGIFLLGIMMPGPAGSTSLFDEDGCDLFTCDIASDIGDLVTIVISESTQATSRSSTQTDKSLNTDGELSVEGFLQWITDLPPTISPIEDLTFTPQEQFSGDGRVTTSGAFTTRVTATVIDRLPNGNLVIRGVREITIAEDTATLSIEGVIQPQDLTSDSTIFSYQISELSLDYQGTGIIADRQHDGILSRLFNFFF
jgi:flagellar L-ring protein FlgH